jgi:hypothetical protein
MGIAAASPNLQGENYFLNSSEENDINTILKRNLLQEYGH